MKMNFYNLIEKEKQKEEEEREEPINVNLSNWFRVNK